mmetsp:Transcript_10117/g.25962  ORF Transcript_10117/g.25962 Transcript_10117/m.25962 type:complete len:373 (-) Transcript_10117:115-1233(-)
MYSYVGRPPAFAPSFVAQHLAPTVLASPVAKGPILYSSGPPQLELRACPRHDVPSVASRSAQHIQHDVLSGSAADAASVRGENGSHAQDKVMHWEQCAAEREAEFAQSEQQVGRLTNMLTVAKAEMECLGEEADRECMELQQELQAKEVALSEALEELSSVRLSTSEEDLRAELSDSRAAYVELHQKLSEQPREFSEPTGDAEESRCVMALGHMLRQRIDQYDNERHALSKAAAAVRMEAHRLRGLDEAAWCQRSSGYEHLLADVACMRSKLQATSAACGGDADGVAAAAATPSSSSQAAAAAGDDHVSVDVSLRLRAMEAELEEARAEAACQCQEVAQLRHDLAEAEETIGMLMRQSGRPPVVANGERNYA